ncbi:MAG TPA: protease modulator HflC [Syntrophaceae bacterium]|nr:protease modulator HflC [Syntrophaceae bacterium]
MKFKGSLIILIIIGFIVVSGAAFVVDETQQVVITQFGKAVGEPITEPGLYFKIPFVQQANYFPKNLLEWDGEAGQIPTLDKTFIWVDTFARWKIVDPLKFFQSVNNETAALARLDDIIDPAVRNAITSYPLIEAVRNSNREMDIFEVGLEGFKRQPIPPVKVGREKITQMILEQAKPKLAKFGIELVDVRIKRINYVEEVRKTVYQRMIAERKQIAEKFRSEGRGESQKIEGDKEKEMRRITSEAYRKAQEIKGKADAEATRIYAEAFSRDPDFYSFVKTLDIYKDTLGKDSTLILGTDSDFFKYLKKYSEERRIKGY